MNTKRPTFVKIIVDEAYTKVLSGFDKGAIITI